MDAVLIRRVREVCPKAQMDVFSFFWRGPEALLEDVPDYVGIMVVMGGSASDIVIPPLEGAALGRLGGACTNVKSCAVDGARNSLHGYRSLFAVPNPSLVCLIVTSRSNFPTPSAIFQALAEKVWTLEEFKYRGGALPVDFLAPLVVANKSLKVVDIIIRTYGGDGYPVCSCCSEHNNGEREGNIDWGLIVAPFLASESNVKLDCTCLYPSRKKIC